MKKCFTFVLAVMLISSCAAPAADISRNDDNTADSAYKGVKQLAKPVLPAIAPYPNGEYSTKAYSQWERSLRAVHEQPEGFDRGVPEFCAVSVPVFLGDDQKINPMYSPISMYMSLAMCAEITDGNTRKQLLDVLHTEDIQDLRTRASSIWKSCYNDDGMIKCVIANSAWINDNITVKEGSFGTLADNYYASVFTGEMGTEKFNKAMQKFFSEGTDGLLDSSTGSIDISPEDALVLASTISFSGSWEYEFLEERTERGTFHAKDGDMECDFMNDSVKMVYYYGDSFKYIVLPFDGDYRMRLILPDKGISPETLINDSKFMEKLFDHPDSSFSQSEYSLINVSLPKFDITSDADITKGMEQLGITDIFGKKADFTPISDSELFLSQAGQSVRVTVDEKGCRAAAISFAVVEPCSEPDNQVDMVFDRPFIFEIESGSGLPLFIGIVNNMQ